MTLAAAEAIVDNSSGELEVYEKYSGRGMYGRQTSGVTGSYQNFYEAIGEIMELEEEDVRIEVAKAIRELRTDTMGLDMIFY